MIAQEQEKSVLEFTLLHHIMLFFDLPASWSVWGMGAAAAFLSLLITLIWAVVGQPLPIALGAGGITLAFMTFDALTFASLPRRGLSYGNWKPQTFFLAVPRLLGAAALALMAIWSGGPIALLLLVLGQGVGAAALWWGAVHEPFRLTISHLHLKTDRMPAHLPPIRLLHLSDFHVERLTRREEAVLAQIKQLQPDLIVISGDFLNLSYVQDPQARTQVQKLLRQITAPHGVYAVLGSPTVDERHSVPSLFDGLPIRLLRDEWVEVELPQGQRLLILGMDCSHELEPDGQKLAHLVRRPGYSANPGFDQPALFLYHSPELMPQASQHNFDLYLCGHTHGGQIRLPLIGPIFTSSQLGREFVMGHYVRGRTNLYVSRGIGLEGLSAPRIRFLCPPEIILVTVGGE